MGFTELLLLAFLVFLLFGPKKTPEIARQVGSALGQFKRATNNLQTQLMTEAASIVPENPARATIDSAFAAWTKSLAYTPPAQITAPLASTVEPGDNQASTAVSANIEPPAATEESRG
jgi:sec-independent protein translocase protein TatB